MHITYKSDATIRIMKASIYLSRTPEKKVCAIEKFLTLCTPKSINFLVDIGQLQSTLIHMPLYENKNKLYNE